MDVSESGGALAEGGIADGDMSELSGDIADGELDLDTLSDEGSAKGDAEQQLGEQPYGRMVSSVFVAAADDECSD